MSQRRPCLRHILFSISIGLVFASLTTLCAPKAYAGNVSSNITTNTVWNAAGSPYNLTTNIAVSSGVTLTIDASGGPVVVNSNGNFTLTINGGISLINTSATNTVTFKHTSSTSRAAWGGILINGASATGSFSNCIVQYAGTGIRVTANATLTATSCTFGTNNVGIAAYEQGVATTSANTFNSNILPIELSPDSISLATLGSPSADTLGTSGNINSYNAIGFSFVDTATANCPADTCTFSSKSFGGIANIPYVMYAAFTFSGSNDVINVDPGVIIKVRSTATVLSFTSGARMNVDGTVGSPVVFTSDTDDTYGGDTNNNSSSSLSTTAWRQISLTGTGHTFDYMIMRGAYEGLTFNTGSGGTITNSTFSTMRDRAVYAANSTVSISDSTIDMSGTAGSDLGVAITVGSLSTLTTARNTIRNAVYPLEVSPESFATLTLGSGADADILGTSTNANTYNAISFGGYFTSTAICPSDDCRFSQRSFGGISNIPYIMDANFTFSGSNDVVNIDPGVVIKFISGSALSFTISSGARLNIAGSSGSPVVMTSSTDDVYGGDTNNNGSASSLTNIAWRQISLTSTANHTIDYLIMRGAYEGITFGAGSSGSVTNSTFTTMRDRAVYATAATITVTDCTFNMAGTTGADTGTAITVGNVSTLTTARNTIRNTYYPIEVSPDSWATMSLGSGANADILDTGTNANAHNAMMIAGFFTSTGVCPSDDCRFSQRTFAGISNIPYILNAAFTFSGSNDVINVDPGVVIKILTGNAISFTVSSGARLNIAGSSGSPAVFTSSTDDAYGGDSDNNGSSSLSNIAWRQISLTSTAAHTINYLIMRGAYEGIAFNTGTSGTVTNSTFSTMRDRGVYMTAATVSISDCTFDLGGSAGNDSGTAILAGNISTLTTARNTFRNTVAPLEVSPDSWATMTLGSGASADILATGSEANTYNALGFGGTFASTSACPADDCRFSQRTFAGISNIPYIMYTAFTFSGSNDTANIDPGVVIKVRLTSSILTFSGGAKIAVAGTAENPVALTAATDDTYGGDTDNNGTSSTTTTSWRQISVAGTGHTFSYMIMKGSYEGLTFNSGSSGTITHSTFSTMRDRGVYATAATVSISDSTFDLGGSAGNDNGTAIIAGNISTLTTARNTIRNTVAPIEVSPDSWANMTLGSGADADILATGSEANTYNAFGFGGAFASTAACPTDDCRFSQRTFAGISNIPYILYTAFTFNGSNDVVNVDSGVIIKARTGTMTVNSGAKLVVAGTSSGKVYFTSSVDDTVGGDTNNDGTATTPSTNNWTGLVIGGTGTPMSITFATIRYANIGMNVTTTGALSVIDSTITLNLIGVYMNSSVSPTFTRTNIEINTTYGMQNNTTTVINAQNVWWGSSTGPNDNNSGGQCPVNAGIGDVVTDTATRPILYCPFSSSKYNTNSSPIATNASVQSGAASVSLTSNTTKSISCTARVTDTDGYTDIQSVQAIFYRTSQGYSGSADDNYRYILTGDSQCIPSGGTGNIEDYTCTFAVKFHADPTSAGTTYASDDWTCRVIPSDGSGEGTFDADAIEINSLLSMNFSNSISYGTLAAGQNTGSTNTQLTVSNVGNVGLTFTMYGSQMCTNYATCTGGTPIAVGNQQYSLSSFTYGAGTTLTGSATTIGDGLIKPTASPSNATQGMYWGMAIPSGTKGGTYTGTVTFTATQN